MKSAKQTEEYGWLVIRLAGLCISLYALYRLIGIAFVAYSIAEKLKPMRDSGVVSVLTDEFRLLVLLPALLYASYLVFGIYCLRGGGFFHRLLCYRPYMGSDAEDIRETDLASDEDTSTGESQSVRPDAQRKLYFQFLRDHPETNQLQSKERHAAFRNWQEEQAK